MKWQVEIIPPLHNEDWGDRTLALLVIDFDFLGYNSLGPTRRATYLTTTK